MQQTLQPAGTALRPVARPGGVKALSCAEGKTVLQQSATSGVCPPQSTAAAAPFILPIQTIGSTKLCDALGSRLDLFYLLSWRLKEDNPPPVCNPQRFSMCFFALLYSSLNIHSQHEMKLSLHSF